MTMHYKGLNSFESIYASVEAADRDGVMGAGICPFHLARWVFQSTRSHEGARTEAKGAWNARRKRERIRKAYR